MNTIKRVGSEQRSGLPVKYHKQYYTQKQYCIFIRLYVLYAFVCVAYHNVAYHYVFLYLKITDNCIKISNKKLLLQYIHFQTVSYNTHNTFMKSFYKYLLSRATIFLCVLSICQCPHVNVNKYLLSYGYLLSRVSSGKLVAKFWDRV